MNAIDERDLNELDRIIIECKNSEHHRIKHFGRTLTNWYSGIKGYIEHSNGYF